jgi:hypothetical protein
MISPAGFLRTNGPTGRGYAMTFVRTGPGWQSLSLLPNPVKMKDFAYPAWVVNPGPFALTSARSSPTLLVLEGRNPHLNAAQPIPDDGLPVPQLRLHERTSSATKLEMKLSIRLRVGACL